MGGRVLLCNDFVLIPTIRLPDTFRQRHGCLPAQALHSFNIQQLTGCTVRFGAVPFNIPFKPDFFFGPACKFRDGLVIAAANIEQRQQMRIDVRDQVPGGFDRSDCGNPLFSVFSGWQSRPGLYGRRCRWRMIYSF